MPTREQNKELVRRFIDEVFNKKNLDYAMEAISDDFVEHQVLPGMTPDKKGTMEQFRVLLEASPDMKAEIHELIASGDRVAPWRGPMTELVAAPRIRVPPLRPPRSAMVGPRILDLVLREVARPEVGA